MQYKIHLFLKIENLFVLKLSKFVLIFLLVNLIFLKNLLRLLQEDDLYFLYLPFEIMLKMFLFLHLSFLRINVVFDFVDFDFEYFDYFEFEVGDFEEKFLKYVMIYFVSYLAFCFDFDFEILYSYLFCFVHYLHFEYY